MSLLCIALYILMANRQIETYRRVFEVVRDHINAVPQSIMLDFEAGARTAFTFVWPDITIRHCLFHLGQSVNRKVQSLGLSQLYIDNEEFRKSIRSLAALAFLQPDEVEYGYQLLRGIAHDQAIQIYDYFET